jgi:hypothetical protein
MAVLALIGALAVAGCGGDDGDEASTTTPTTTHASTPSTKPDSTKSGPKKSGRQKSGSKTSGSKKSGSKKSASGKSGPKKSGQPRKTTPAGGTPVGTVPSGAGPAVNERAVVRTVSAYLRAIARGDGPQACAQLTSEAQDAVERKVARAAPETKGSPCDASITLYQSSYQRAAGGVRVTDVRLAGDRAKAVALDKAASLVKHGRTWLIARYEL